MFHWILAKKGGFEGLPPEDTEHLLSPDFQPSKERPSGPTWLAVVVITTITAVVSAFAGAWTVHHDRLNADAFSMRHISQHCGF